jgi:hypothetical protein
VEISDCISQQYLSGGSIYCGCLNKIALPFLILRLELPETANFPRFEVFVVVLSVLSSGIWAYVDSYVGGFT